MWTSELLWDSLTGAMASPDLLARLGVFVDEEFLDEAPFNGEGRRRTRVLAELALLSSRGGSAHTRLREQRKRLHQAIGAMLRQQEVELEVDVG